MTARFFFVLALATALIPTTAIAQGRFLSGASRLAAGQHVSTTPNFVVHAPDARLAKQVASEAERFRKELSQLWLGYEIKPWSERCPIQVRLDRHAGGETSFAFVGDGVSKSTPTGWKMEIFGPPDRLLDAVLPHEITHTIFATHFGRPLPRWADEGACTTVEHHSERKKNHQMLIDFLTSSPSRGIPFNRMFTMRQYPHDILPLYAQGYSLAKFLIMQKGRREFLDYLSDGMNTQRHERDSRAWDVATDQHYGYRDLSELQLAWIDWVKAGSVEQPPIAATLASYTAEEASSKESNVDLLQSRAVPAARVASVDSSAGWYARQMRVGASLKVNGSERVATNRYAIEAAEANDRNEREKRQPQFPEAGFRDSRVDSTTIWR
jgi:hypothetical protein